tara:strand:- start:10 stop:1041 length:1032 start_codon:yes stop_codon:yes gene_type:complete
MAYISFQPSDYFATKLWTGTGASNAQTGVGFQPDFTWIKNRDDTDCHVLTDAVRGVTKYLQSNDTTAETTNVETLKTFDSDGFTVGTSSKVNTNTEKYAAWNWKAGTTSGIATNGSTTITPNSYSFNQTSGVSILQYTGNSTDDAKLAHGLGVAPHLVICKEQNVSSNNWAVWHVSLGNDVVALDTTAAKVAGNSRFSNEAPDAVNITLGSDGSTNLSGNMICYAFAPIKGFSKFGSFTGNGNADGTFIYTGFRPAWVLVKVKNYTAAWTMFDNKRIGYNPTNRVFTPNTTGVDYAGHMSDIYSNGFKPFNNDPQINGSYEYCYAAFAESPIVSSNDIPVTAR